MIKAVFSTVLMVLAILALPHPGHAFSIASSKTLVSTQRLLNSRRYFFKDLLDKAFANDENISQDEKVTGQIEGPGNEEDDTAETRRRNQQLTETQQKWRQMNSQAVTTLAGQSFDFNFFLTGVPNKDPSNDLFGAKVNISSRDRQVGQTVPEAPTLSNIRVTFLEQEKCVCETESSFTSRDSSGDWKLSEDGRQIRFRIPVTGFTRTVETRGSIQSVAWSNQPDQTTRASTIYSIPPGWMYGEAQVTNSGGGLQNKNNKIVWDQGVLKIEQATGMLGAGSRMAPCGKFQVQMVSMKSGVKQEEEVTSSDKRGTL